jgi:hypothetical protein
LGSPAFGWALTRRPSAADASSESHGRISSAPSAQLMPTERGRAWATEIRNASTVWPDSVRPERSVTVTEIMIGRSAPRSSRTSWQATIAALAFSVSKIVSMSRMSAPPSTSPRTWST